MIVKFQAGLVDVDPDEIALYIVVQNYSVRHLSAVNAGFRGEIYVK